MTDNSTFINEIILSMTPSLTDSQLNSLENILNIKLHNYDINKKVTEIIPYTTKNYEKYLQLFCSTKVIEGCSEKTISSYNYNILKMLSFLDKNIEEITSDDLRFYLANYKMQRKVSNATLDNMRRYFLTFFSWAADEHITSSNPAKNLKKIKQEKVIKEPLTEQEIEILRLNCRNERDRALIEILYSTGMRVGELEQLNKDQIDFMNKQIIVFGKGSKERIVYLNARACLYIERYLATRHDNNEALFVGLRQPYSRLKVASIEKILRELGEICNIKCNPHKFRRTAATTLLNKGMPVQEVSKILGHAKLETTMIYCTVDNENVQANHKKFLN